MKHETEFRTYLTTDKRSARTGKTFSSKVARDTLSRCKVVERALGIEFSERTLGSDVHIQKVCGEIKASKLSSTDARPYAHNELILVVRSYGEFLTWLEGR